MHHPILGDKIYGGKIALKIPTGIQHDRLYLHSEELSFFHPESGKFVSFSAPLPGYFSEAIRLLRTFNE
jgi:23S rRNA pseudouridine1911/1915/1917 synthase